MSVARGADEGSRMVVEQSVGRIRKGGFSLRWDARRAADAYRDGWWIDGTLADDLRRAAVDTPGRVLVVDGEVRLDARTLHAQAVSLARGLMARMPAGSVVSFMLPNWNEAAVLYHAITLAGMVAHPVLPSMRDHELLFQLRDIGSRMVLIPSEFRRHDYAAMLARVVAQLESPPAVHVVRGDPGPHAEYAALFGAGIDLVLPGLDPDAVRMVMYTSGTSGRAKGVLHTHNTLHALMRQIGHHWHVSPGDVFLVPSPISHIGGSIYAFEAPVMLGTSAVLMDRWEPQAALALAAREGCTHICGATPFLEQLLAAAKAEGSQLPSLKLFVCGGASVPPSLVRSAAAHFSSAAVTRVYGSTEVPVTTVGCPARDDLDRAAATDGRPGVANVRIVFSGQAADGEGEIRVQGPQMMAGYLHAEDEASAFDRDGFYRTGDLGRWVGDDCLVVSGRSKDIIIRHGENIAPKEIEDMLLEHPQIAEIAIVGIPDLRTGERACAVIVPASGSAAPDVESLAGFLAERGVAKFKFPEEVVAWAALPKNDAGKILKHGIRSTLAQRATHTGTELA
ncbi:AMP-binding protein [Luteimonas sp. A501]